MFKDFLRDFMDFMSYERFMLTLIVIQLFTIQSILRGK